MSTAVVAAREAGSQAALIEASIAGDERAFAAIVDRHRVAVIRTAYVVCGDRDLAEDAVQAMWPIAWQRLRSVREPDRLGAWLASIAVNEARQLLRRRRRRSVVEIAVSIDPSSDASRGGTDPALTVEDIDLARALDRLAPEDRALLALRYVGGLTSFELGPALGMSPSGLRRRLARLLEELRKELGDA